MNVFTLLLPLTLPLAIGAQEGTDTARWSNWRGPTRNGAAHAGAVPTTWSTTENRS